MGVAMSFRISTEQIGDVAVLQCAGRVVDPEALNRLKDAVTSLSQLRVVVLDLSAVEMVDGRGLGMLVFLHNWACATAIQVKLVNPSKLVREMLEVTRLTSVLHVSSVDDLVEMFCNSHRVNENADRAAA
jgi:anti-anti-sigma factor